MDGSNRNARDAVAAAPISQTIDDRIYIRGRDLAEELIGSLSFTEMFLLDLDGEPPTPQRTAVVDAVLVAMMEHGIVPATLVCRMTLDSAPESIQGAIAAGLLAGGSRYLGISEQVAQMLQSIVEEVGTGSDDELDSVARRAVAELKACAVRVPGFGHNLHQDVDPRVERLREIAEANEAHGRHLDALDAVWRAVAATTSSRRLIPNAAGVIGAVLSDLGYAPEQARGFALVARCAGLLAHITDERARPISRPVWQRAHEEFGK